MRVTLPICLALSVLSGPLNAKTIDCVFTTECVATEACQPNLDAKATLSEEADDWSLQLDDDTFTIIALPAGNDRTFSGYIYPSDIDADAITLLSLYADGTILMSTHGTFLTPGVITTHGTCQGKEL